MMRTLDEWILDRFQAASDWIHEWTGADCIVQARAFAGLCAVGWLLVMVVGLNGVRSYFDWLGGINLVALLHRAFWESAIDATARQAAAGGFRNPRRAPLNYVFFRLFYDCFAVFSLPFTLVRGVQLFGCLVVCLCITANFESCDVQAPRAARLREALRVFTTSKNLSEVKVTS